MASEDLPSTIADVPTPCFLVDIDKVKSNCKKMRETCEKMDVDLRPHMKTHKTVEGGVIMTGGTKRKIVVSTVDEAKFFASHGFDDILFGRVATKDKLPVLRKVANKLEEFHVFIDNQVHLDGLKEIPLEGGKKWSVLLKVDTGYGRSGVMWDSDVAVELAKKVAESDETKFLGIYTHCGSSYDLKGEEELKKYGDENADRLLSLAKRLTDAGIECPVIGTGSTPSCSKASEKMAFLTEFHPGNYIFYDCEHANIGACIVDEIACRVATRVISHRPELNQLLVDCGFLAMTHDGIQLNLPRGYCVFQDNPNLKMVGMSQELGKIRPIEGKLNFDKYPIGSMLFIYPFHSCVAAAMHPFYYVHSGEKIVGKWTPTRGWI